MYESFYNLKEKPFDLHPDPEYLFMSRGHDNAYTHLEYAIAENKGFVVITGEIGSGKTTLINYFLDKIQQDILVGLINNTHAPLKHLIKMICQEFELETADLDQVELLERFHEFLIRQFEQKMRVVLIIDEAQNLPPDALEEIRLLSNLETEKHHLIQIILVGQPELRHKLQQKILTQFAQRVTVHCHLDHLGKEEVSRYIAHRLKVAGAVDPDIFKNDAIQAIYDYSQGIPRLMNILCDTALVYGYADGQKTITKKVIADVIQAREAGGIFTDASEENPAGQTPEPGNMPLPGDINEKFKIMEQRLGLLENIVDQMSHSLDRLLRKKNERDDIVLELFKLLKVNMESRLQALVKFNRYRKKMGNHQKEPETNNPKSHPPFLLRFKKKKKAE